MSMYFSYNESALFVMLCDQVSSESTSSPVVCVAPRPWGENRLGHINRRSVIYLE